MIKKINYQLLILSILLMSNAFHAYSQFLGGNGDGEANGSNLSYVADCGLSSFINTGTGGNAGGQAMGENLSYVADCGIPIFSYAAPGGNADGNIMCPSGGCFTLPLPIELLSFTAQLIDKNKVLCEWTTLSEINNDYFIAEKTENGSNFYFVEKVDGAGNSNTQIDYSIIDHHPYQGISYYRLKQVDFNGDFSYSDLVAINLQGLDIINMSPNPAKDKITILLYSTEKTNVNINVYNIVSEKVFGANISIEKGTNPLPLDISSFSTGYYLLEVETATGLYRVQKNLVKR